MDNLHQRQGDIAPLLRLGKPLFYKVRAFWFWLSSPSGPVKRPDLLRQSRLLAGVLLVVILAGLISEALTVQTAVYQGYQNLLISFLLLAILLAAFLLNRYSHYSAASWISIIVISAGVFILTFVTDGLPVNSDFLVFLFIPLLLASVLFSGRTFLLLTLIYMTAITSLIFVPGIDPNHILLGPLPFVGTASGIVFAIYRYRDQLERDRHNELVEREERYRTLLETRYEGICVIAGETIVDANPNFARLFGCRLSEVIGEPVSKIIVGDLEPKDFPEKEKRSAPPARVPVVRKDGSQFFIETVSRMQIYRGQPVRVIAVRDVTEQVRAEAALKQNESLYRTLFEGANDAIFLLSMEDTHIAANQKAADMLGYSVQELIGKSINEVVVQREYPGAQKIKKALLSGETVPLYERIVRKKDGSEFPVEINATLIRDQNGEPQCIQSIVRDITGRKRSEALIRTKIQHLQALREIDQAINASHSLQVTLNLVLSQAIKQLGFDAADVFLLNPDLSLLEYAAAQGFSYDGVWREPLKFKDSLAGRAALERQTVSILDLPFAAAETHSPRLDRLARHGFQVGFAIPLIAKGLVKGVLEIFCRRPLEPSPEWIDFLDTLAGQAAIAVEGADLFQNLQRSNIDLIQAYDATLEGWVKALELRDKETEGHSQRVTEMTVRLGRALGIAEDRLVHMQRGALLHDIGKMGIPDAILLKPGPLTAEEWRVMKQHPDNAFRMLAAIPFLRPALDIPYAHHERWDGSGYPRGLKGEQIPLAARIFTVVDVWDAVTSDRPYRKAWPREMALAHLRDESGIKFDPQVVAAFLEMIEGK